MHVSRSSYYEWVSGTERKREKSDGALLASIRQAERENHGNLGVRHVYHVLRDDYKIMTSKRRVQRIMHNAGIKAKRSLKYKPQTTHATPNETAFPNLLNQQFQTERSNQIWLADITYIRVGGKWAYLAVVYDLYSRMPVGWALGRSPSSELACTALRYALKRRKPSRGLIHHSDRGSQYTSKDYRKLLEKYGVVGSMSRKGNPYDNAPMESFFKTLKVEWVNYHPFNTIDEAWHSLFYYIDVYYSCKRLHSALGYQTPKNYENRTFIAI